MKLEKQEEFYNELWGQTKKLNSLKLRRAVKILSYFVIVKKKFGTPNVLDLGCGEGRLTAFVGEFSNILGIELSEVAVNNASIKYTHAKYKQGNVFDIDFSGEKFDLIISQEVIEHVEDQDKYLSICFEVLNNGGYLILTTPNKNILDHMANGSSWSNQPIENVLKPSELKKKVSEKFRVLKYDSIILNFGDSGFYKIVNSKYVIGLFNKLGLSNFREYVLGKLGFGLHQCVLAIKDEKKK